MKNMNVRISKVLVIVLFLLSGKVYAQDPNFYIFLCFGQSNMEGQGTIEAQDRVVDSRLKVLEAVNCSNLGRTMGLWYKAVPPLTRCYNGLSPADYFGKTMVASLPFDRRIGIINVSVGGCKIELFDKNNYQAYVSTITEDWLKNIIAEYGGNPYGRLVEMAKLAQKDGVIKGILLHQGESNTGDAKWPSKVKVVYDNLLKDLNLIADSVPLLAGEVVNADQGGLCASMNTIIAKLPLTIPTSHVISSKGCTDAADNIHFNSAGYREIGKRYADKMLSVMGLEPIVYYEAECATIGENWEIRADAGRASNGKFISIKAGMNSLSTAPTEIADAVSFPFTVTSDKTQYIYARLNHPNTDGDSWWIKVDNDEFVKYDFQATVSWQWLKIGSYELAKGPHTLTFAYCEDGAKMDKICISQYDSPPSLTGDLAKNICNPYLTSVENNLIENPSYLLGINYPNPFTGITTISFEIPKDEFVSIKVNNILGREIAELAGMRYSKGKHSIDFNAEDNPNGIYFYSMKAGTFSATQKMIIRK